MTPLVFNAKIFSMRWLFLGVFLLLFVITHARADIYKQIDENGVIYYSDVPHWGKTSEVIKDRVEKSSNYHISTKSASTEKLDFHDIINEKAAMYDIDPSLIKAVIKAESNWDCRAVSRKGAMGLMQLMPSTAVEMNVRDPFDPEENIEGGVKYLKHLLERFKGDLILALAAYNAGPTTVEKYGYIPPIAETKQYVQKVLNNYNGKTIYSKSGSSLKKEKKSDYIYKIVLEDGTILFTNSYLSANNVAKF